MTPTPLPTTSSAPSGAVARYRVAVVIINYRTAKLVIDCLNSLQNEIAMDRDIVIVVDNCSGDDSAERLHKYVEQSGYDAWVRLIRSPVNGGFAAGNNVGIQTVDAEAYLLLNSDTIVHPGSIDCLYEVMQRHPQAGLISPRLLTPQGPPQISNYRFDTPLHEMAGAARTRIIERLLARKALAFPITDEPFTPDWTSFACILIRRQVIEQVGLLDEGYFMYFEDQDYCRQAANHGWQTLHWPAASILHLAGGSGPVRSSLAERRRPPRYYWASRNRYFAKHYGWLGLCATNILWMVGRSISLLRELLGIKKRHIVQHAWKDIWTNIGHPLRPHEPASPRSAS